MPLAHPTHIVSFSSEDPHHPASNLLNRETFRKWKCKEAGEKEAFVILKFDKAVSINCVDVGNDGSALVEVSVARSGNSGEDQYEVLLSSTAFMSPLDSREGKNLNGVKSFSINSLSKPVAAQKWDLVKVLVSQPFNRHVQYGLTFIKFMVAPDPNEPPKIGMFGLRKPIGGGSSDEDDAVRPGSLFTSRLISPKTNSGTAKSPLPFKPSSSSSTDCKSTSIAIREATAKLTSASKSSSEADVKDLLRRPKIDLPSPSSSRNASSSRDSPLPNRKQLPDLPFKTNDKNKNGTPTAAKIQNKSIASSSPKVANSPSNSKKRTLSPDVKSSPKPGPSTSSGTPAKKAKKERKTKPFKKLFEGVIFSMSGFENPLRGQIRDKAVEMGARYKADWDRSCTHLICAFFNTPKFRQVRGAGNGEIVKKDWIVKSYADKCRYPWRRYCLDKSDQGSESEDEIFAESNGNDEELLDDETIEDESDNDEVSSSSKPTRKRLVLESDEDEKSDDSKKAYDADTDVDEDRTPDLSPSIMDQNGASDSSPFLKDFNFCLDVSDSSQSVDNTKLTSIITKHKGRVDKSLSDSTEYLVCHSFEWKDDFSDALSDNPNLLFVHKNWIFECDKEDQILEKAFFMLSPS